MSFIDSEDEINYDLQDIDNMCQKKEEFNIDDLLVQEEQKEDKEEIIEDMNRFLLRYEIDEEDPIQENWSWGG